MVLKKKMRWAEAETIRTLLLKLYTGLTIVNLVLWSFLLIWMIQTPPTRSRPTSVRPKPFTKTSREPCIFKKIRRICLSRFVNQTTHNMESYQTVDKFQTPTWLLRQLTYKDHLDSPQSLNFWMVSLCLNIKCQSIRNSTKKIRKIGRNEIWELVWA